MVSLLKGMAKFTASNLGVDFDALDLKALALGKISNASATSFTVTIGPAALQVMGSGLQYGANGWPTSGQVDRLVSTYQGQAEYDLSGFSISGGTFASLVQGNPLTTTKALVLGAEDTIAGSTADDRLQGMAGDDTIHGHAGVDQLSGGDGDDDVYGGLGNDSIDDAAGSNYLRGDEGDDYVVGGLGFDDINGNVGNDVCFGGFGSDWVVGGKDHDILWGEEGDDLVYGNLGNDTCDGGEGADIVRGGQGNDSISGGAGSDYMSGDRGDDVVRGGAGADLFHSFAEAGLDRIVDFSVAEGDRVLLDLGSTYSVAQIGADTAINIVGGAQVILVGVSMSSLTAASIVVG